jgi:hypothetical protein
MRGFRAPQSTADPALRFPNAAFTLFRTVTTAEVEEEFRLGTFELRENLSLSEK